MHEPSERMKGDSATFGYYGYQTQLFGSPQEHGRNIVGRFRALRRLGFVALGFLLVCAGTIISAAVDANNSAVFLFDEVRSTRFITENADSERDAMAPTGVVEVSGIDQAGYARGSSVRFEWHYHSPIGSPQAKWQIEFLPLTVAAKDRERRKVVKTGLLESSYTMDSDLHDNMWEWTLTVWDSLGNSSEIGSGVLTVAHAPQLVDRVIVYKLDQTNFGFEFQFDVAISSVRAENGLCEVAYRSTVSCVISRDPDSVHVGKIWVEDVHGHVGSLLIEQVENSHVATAGIESTDEMGRRAVSRRASRFENQAVDHGAYDLHMCRGPEITVISGTEHLASWQPYAVFRIYPDNKFMLDHAGGEITYLADEWRMSDMFDVQGGPDPFDPTANPTSLAYAYVSNELQFEWAGRISGNVTLGLAREGVANIEGERGGILAIRDWRSVGTGVVFWFSESGCHPEIP